MFYASRGTDWNEVAAVLRGVHPLWMLSVVAMSLACHAIRAERWRVLLRPVGRPLWVHAFASTLVGFGANSVLPFRLGEIVRPAMLTRRSGIAMSSGVSSVVLERLFDILLVVCCFLVVGLVFDLPGHLRQAAIGLGAAVVVGFVVLALMQRHRTLAERLIGRMLGMLPGRAAPVLGKVVEGLFDGVGGLADRRTIALVLGHSVVLWIGITMTYLLSFFALDVAVPPVAGSLATVVIVAAFVFLPQLPGFVGGWQAGCVLALRLFGVSEDVAFGYSLLTWVIQMGVNVGSAAVCLALEGVSVGDLVRDSRREVPEA